MSTGGYKNRQQVFTWIPMINWVDWAGSSDKPWRNLQEKLGSKVGESAVKRTIDRTIDTSWVKPGYNLEATQVTVIYNSQAKALAKAQAKALRKERWFKPLDKVSTR